MDGKYNIIRYSTFHPLLIENDMKVFTAASPPNNDAKKETTCSPSPPPRAAITPPLESKPMMMEERKKVELDHNLYFWYQPNGTYKDGDDLKEFGNNLYFRFRNQHGLTTISVHDMTSNMWAMSASFKLSPSGYITEIFGSPSKKWILKYSKEKDLDNYDAIQFPAIPLLGKMCLNQQKHALVWEKEEKQHLLPNFNMLLCNLSLEITSHEKISNGILYHCSITCSCESCLHQLGLFFSFLVVSNKTSH